MYFGIGAHPGFNVPLEDRAVFEDYYLEFDSVSEVKRVGFSKDCFVTGELFDFPLEDDVRISLSHHLFDKDAIVLTNVPRSVTLKSNTCNKGIRVIYPAMHYLGIWHMPKTDAPYVCIEPWSSLPSRKDVVEDIETQPELVALKNGCEYKNQCCIEFLRNKE